MTTCVTTATLHSPVDAVRTDDGSLFDTDTYSRMKHGDAAAIDSLGAKLAAALVQQCPHLLTDAAIPTLPVAYLAVRPSCWFLADAVLSRVNAARAEQGLQPGRIVQVRKDSVTHTDYAASTQAEREAELARIGFSLAEPIDGTNCVVIDDVRVTGLAERTVLAALEAAAPATLVTAYVAVCSPELAASPHVESALNHATITSILQMVPAARAGRFHLTIRFLKRALASPELPEFVAEVPNALVREMYEGALATGPEFIAGYPDGFATLQAAIQREVAHV
ncbi:phosphoribosyltransferase family protein [Yimella sp. cx-51]|uniref:phosphoribosyltransferase family protein n=1 Tax=Yimella sp. cx-51 TaxID=2770551 RepID=UPI00165E423F|nr:phosphoribosyltransferase family protein [Yimella sp. cx-51]MBC9957946.1 hypothetical protein [Yimella sp. cx-51]QTH38079.1 hypothetical protein J5M86_14820 [Yimella sp. cx-51]